MSEAIMKAFDDFMVRPLTDQEIFLAFDMAIEYHGEYDSSRKQAYGFIAAYNLAKSESEQQIKEMREALQDIKDLTNPMQETYQTADEVLAKYPEAKK